MNKGKAWEVGSAPRKRCQEDSLALQGEVLWDSKVIFIKMWSWKKEMGDLPGDPVRVDKKLKVSSCSAFTGGHWRCTPCGRRLPFICSY
jgi:uncharacterized cupin superfamily protein